MTRTLCLEFGLSEMYNYTAGYPWRVRYTARRHYSSKAFTCLYCTWFSLHRHPLHFSSAPCILKLFNYQHRLTFRVLLTLYKYTSLFFVWLTATDLFWYCFIVFRTFRSLCSGSPLHLCIHASRSAALFCYTDKWKLTPVNDSIPLRLFLALISDVWTRYSLSLCPLLLCVGDPVCIFHYRRTIELTARPLSRSPQVSTREPDCVVYQVE